MTAPTEDQLDAIAATFVGRLSEVADRDYVPPPPRPRRGRQGPACSVCGTEGQHRTIILEGPARRSILTRRPYCNFHTHVFATLHRARRPELILAGLPVVAFNPEIVAAEDLEEATR